jgi:hypothetical protein
MPSRYEREHLEAFRLVRGQLDRLPQGEREGLLRRIGPYLDFRSEVRAFQEERFSEVCTAKCFRDGTSACCAREGIAAFFADVVISTLLSTAREIDLLEETLAGSSEGPGCVYLGPSGCLWRLKPIACEMFLCDHARSSVLDGDEAAASRWEALRAQERLFTWPDRPVLFDDLEARFMEAGLESPLMYCHRSPGLLRVKARAGLGSGTRRPGASRAGGPRAERRS